MVELIVLALAGAFGAFMRAFVSQSHETFSRKTAGEVFIGLATGLLYYVLVEPLVTNLVTLPTFPDPRVGVTVKAALLMVITYVVGDVISNRLPGLLGAKPAGTPDSGNTEVKK